MRLKFKNQDFQTNAVNAVVDLFAGQENTHSTFSVTNDLQVSLNDFGVGNILRIDRNTLAEICTQCRNAIFCLLQNWRMGCPSSALKWKQAQAKHTSIPKPYLNYIENTALRSLSL